MFEQKICWSEFFFHLTVVGVVAGSSEKRREITKMSEIGENEGFMRGVQKKKGKKCPDNPKKYMNQFLVCF